MTEMVPTVASLATAASAADRHSAVACASPPASGIVGVGIRSTHVCKCMQRGNSQREQPRRATCSSESSPSSDITQDPTTGKTPSEQERIKAMVDHRASTPKRSASTSSRLGEHHNPPFFSSSPTTMLALHRRADRAAHPLDLHDADHHERPGEDRRGLRDAAAPRRRPRRPDDGPRQHRPGLPLVRQGHPPGHPARHRELRAAAPAVARGRRRLGGQVPHAAAGLHLDARARSTACRRSSGTARSAARRSPSRPRTTATASSPTTSSGPTEHYQRMIELYRQRFEHYGHGTAEQAIVGLGGQVVHAQELAGRGAASSAPTSTTRPSTATARRWRSSPSRRRSPSAARRRSSTRRSPSATTSATTSASCSSWTTRGCR